MSFMMNVRPWLPVFGGAMVYLTMGTLYSFGNMNPYITSYLRHYKIAADMEYSSSVWVYAATLSSQGLSVFLGGALEKRIGTRFTVLLGAWIMSLGVLLTNFSIQHSFSALLATYGLLFGIGIGIATAPTLSCAMKWHPRRKGLANGIVAAGFGMGAFVFNQVQTAYINPNNVSPTLIVNGDRYFDNEDLLSRVPTCFLIIGGIYAGMQLLACTLIRDPPECQEEMKPIKGNLADSSSYRPCQVLRTRAFYTLWVLFLFNGQASTFIVSLYKAYGQTFIADDEFLALVGAFASILNSFGRILWGIAGDRFSFRVTMICLCSTLMFFMLTLVATSVGKEPMFFIWICCIFTLFSGNFALFPTVTAKVFGAKYFGVIYGMLFTSQVVTSLTGALLTTTLTDTIGWFGMFCLNAGFSFIGCICAFSFNMKKPDGSDV